MRQSKKLICKQCSWQGPVQSSIREMETEEPERKREVDPDTAEVIFKVTDAIKKVWSPIGRDGKEGEEVRYKCPVCKAPLMEVE